MPFLVATTFLLYAHTVFVFLWWRSGNPSSQIENSEPRENLGIVAAHYMMSLCFAVGFFFSILTTHSPDQFNWAVPASLVFGIGSFLLFGRYLLRAYRKNHDDSFWGWKTGINLWAIIASAYITFTVVDHLLFFEIYPGKTALGSVDFFGITDEDCKEKRALIRIEEKSAVYRCPTSVSIGNLTAKPFIPWPSYVEGHSTDLKASIEEVMKSQKEH